MSVEEAMKQFPEKAGIARYGEPEEIVGLMAYLVSRRLVGLLLSRPDGRRRNYDLVTRRFYETSDIRIDNADGGNRQLHRVTALVGLESVRFHAVTAEAGVVPVGTSLVVRTKDRVKTRTAYRSTIYFAKRRSRRSGPKRWRILGGLPIELVAFTPVPWPWGRGDDATNARYRRSYCEGSAVSGGVRQQTVRPARGYWWIVAPPSDRRWQGGSRPRGH